MEQAIAFGRERVVVLAGSFGRGIPVMPDQFRAPQDGKSVLQPAVAAEAVLEGNAQGTQLPHRKRAALDGGEDVEVAEGQLEGSGCHRDGRYSTLPSFHSQPVMEKKAFIDVDALLPQVSLEQAAT